MTIKNFKNISDNFIYWPELSQPQLSKIDFSSVPMSEILPIFKEQSKDKIQPTAPYIFQFYAYNHIINDLCKKHCDVVPKEYLDLYLGYQQLLNELSQKIFTYILVTSLTEAGYCNNLKHIFDYIKSKEKNINFFDFEVEYSKYIEKINNPQGKKIIDKVIKEIFSDNVISSVDNNSLVNLVQEIGFNYCNLYAQTNLETCEDFLDGHNISRFKNITTGSLINIIKEIFTNGKFEKNYAGEKWKKILEHLHLFNKGFINAEIFIDQAFSLEHNNGSLFSKNIIFETSEKYNIVIQNNLTKEHESEKYFVNFNQILLNTQNHSSIFKILQMDIQGLLDINRLKESVDYNNIEQFLTFQKYIKQKCSLFLDKFSHLFNEKVPVDFSEILNFDKNTTDIISHNVNNLNILDKNPFVFNIYDIKSILKRHINKDIIGNKAWGIAQLNAMGIPTPQSLVLDIATCLSFLHFPDKFNNVLKKKKKSFHTVLGTEETPKMVSVRSGSNISMPGMMNTILNVGIDDKTYKNLCLKYSKDVIDECSIKFMFQLTKDFKNINNPINLSKSLEKNLENFKIILTNHNIEFNGDKFPLNRDEQIQLCIKNVFSSCNSERAIEWRKKHSIYNQPGTSCTIQEMVLGNLNDKSMSGVIFSRDCILGTDNMIGEYLCNAQGEDIVSGSHTPLNIEQMKIDFPKIYNQLKMIAKVLEDEYQCIQDIEFTVQNGKLYILQYRKAVVSPIANAKLINTYYNLLSDLDMSVITKSLDVQTSQPADITGKCAQDGILHGIIINSEDDKVKFQKIYHENSFRGNFGWILSTKKSSTEHTPLLLKSDGFITQQGGNTCHAAIIARSLKKPCIVGTGLHNLKPGDIITMNAYSGEIWKGIIPISYDSSQSYSISRDILKISNFTEDNLSFNNINMIEKSCWNAQFTNSNILHKHTPKEILKDIQKAAVMLISTYKKKHKY